MLWITSTNSTTAPCEATARARVNRGVPSIRNRSALLRLDSWRVEIVGPGTV